MCSLVPYQINLKGLASGLTQFEFSLDDVFFEALDSQEISGGTVHVALTVERNDRVFRLDFHSEGTVIVPCDLCLDDMELPICTDSRLTAKFGDEESEDDELVIVPEHSGVLDLSWFIYEQIALSIPIKHVHPSGECNVAMIEKLQELSAAPKGDDSDAGESVIDSRWSALKDIKI